MSYRGKVRNGVVEFEDGPVPPDGTIVRIEPVDELRPPDQRSGTLGERLLRHAGTAGEGLPADLARNHDHYLHGQPRR
ncbi:MAG: hypothetical protein CHACPFDD_02444 [Phycisphaerae bacterium]|nr:hypothetical protein [Phycisphaerae bacterium]